MSHAHSDTLPRNLAEWCGWLCDKEMPIFSGTVRNIRAIVNDARAGAMDMARIVMADPNLSLKVLKIGNSAYYNPSRQVIGTLTKAIILLGANVINELALTTSYIESIQSAKQRDNANREIADALHAAVQAKSLAQLCHDTSPEEVFLAALFYNIGHVAFWCFEEQIGEKIDALVLTQGLSIEEAEQRVLGFRLRDLGAALTKTWHLKGLIEEVHLGKGQNALRLKLVYQAHELVKLHKRSELDITQIKALMAPLEKSIHKTPAEMLKLVERNTRIAIGIATQYGVESAPLLLQAPGLSEDDLPNQPRPELPATVSVNTFLPAKNKRLVLQQIQQDISNQLSDDFDLNLLLEMIIEGIQRGLPMDRALFALLNRGRDTLREKAAIGWPSPLSRLSLRIRIAEPGQTPDILTYALQGSGAVWIRPDDEPQWARLYTPTIASQFGRHECFAAPLAANNRPIGIMYADRALSGVALDQPTFDDFCHLIQQANFGIRLSQLQR